MSTANTLDRIVGSIREQGASLSGSGVGWVQSMRSNALREFKAEGIPTTRNEAWKYTDLSRAEAQLNAGPASAGSLSADEIEAFRIDGLDAHEVVFVDGRYSETLSAASTTLPAGVRLASLAALLEEGAADAEAHLNDFHVTGSFTALNTALMRDGYYLEIDRGVIVEKPIHVLFVSTSGTEQSMHIRNLIVAHETSSVKVVEEFAATGAVASFTNAVTDIEAMAAADVEHFKLQFESQKQLHVGAIHVHQHRDSNFRSHAISMGAALSRTDIHAELNAEGAECTLNGLYLVSGRQHVDHHTIVDHYKPNCTSRELYKGILDGRARAVFNGRAVVHEQAQKSDAKQSNANLLLSEKAEVDTKPELEIYADDVKCAHGATTGRIDENQLFYLRSRGLSETAARNVLTFAFADDVLARITIAPLRKYLEQQSLARLPEAEAVKELV